MNKSPYQFLKERTLQANRMLAQNGLSILTWGNASEVNHAQGVMAIKPSGIPYDVMTLDDIVVLSLSGEQLEGDCRPSVDTPTHLALYREFQDIGGIVHTHSKFATAFSQAGREIPCHGTTHADTFHGKIPITQGMTPEQLMGNYEEETGHLIIQCLHENSLDPMEMPGILVRSHAPFAWGASAAHAVENALILEKVAEMCLLTQQINSTATPLPFHLQEKHYQRKHGPSASYGQPLRKTA